MELPRRTPGDELLPSGALLALRMRLRGRAAASGLTTVIACAFDHRTRMLPFIVADTRMAPAGVRSLAAEMLDAGFYRTRIVLQQWNPNFRPSRARLEGRSPDLLLISSMQMHWQQAMALVADAHRIDPAHRPLIVVGGPKCIYEPWDVLAAPGLRDCGADVAVTGESYVLLEMLERLLEARAAGEPLREAFYRCRDAGGLDDIPGLVYGLGDAAGARPPEQLVDTGIQRLVGDLDELADPVLGYRVLEPASKRPTLATRALGPRQIRWRTPIASIVMTLGCKFGCPYCPIPAYNQRQYRTKSGSRIADEIEQLYHAYGLQYYFGADDNFFNDPQRTLAITGELIGRAESGSAAIRRCRLATEVTVHDTLAMREHLPQVRRAGVRALWLGVEDMTGALVRKGQNADQTQEAFRLLADAGILPMPMMMHHDRQPLITRGSDAGLINQVRLLRKAGAINLQALMISPAPGSKLFEQTYTDGMVYDTVGGRTVEPHMIDGNYVVASQRPRPWQGQLNLLAAYAYFFNPLRLAASLIRPRVKIPLNERWPGQRRPRLGKRVKEALRARLMDPAMQLYGMYGLVQSIRRTLPWTLRLMRRTSRRTDYPRSALPMRDPAGGPAAHALPGTPAAACACRGEYAGEAEPAGDLQQVEA